MVQQAAGPGGGIVPAISRQFPIRLNVETDADILAYLDAQTNRTEAIRIAIRAQIQKEA